MIPFGRKILSNKKLKSVVLLRVWIVLLRE